MPYASSTSVRRDLLLMLLTVVSGAIDAISFVKLGGVFTSVMTGNLVLLGVAAGRRAASFAIRAGLALSGYIIGSMLGVRIAGSPDESDQIWPSRVTFALAVEFIVFLFFAIGWQFAGGHPSGALAATLLTFNAVGLGIQSGAVLCFGISGLSTTYLTGTLTGLTATFAANRKDRTTRRSLAALLGMVIGAVVGATIAWNDPRWVPIVPIIPLGAVIALAIGG